MTNSKDTAAMLLYGAILGALKEGPATPREVLDRYTVAREETGNWLPFADLPEIRLRMDQLEHDHKRIEATGGRYAGQRVMRLVEAVA